MKDSFKTYPQDGSWMSAYKWKQRIKKQIREKYRKLCETRIANIVDDAVAFFIEELLEGEAEEILAE